MKKVDLLVRELMDINAEMTAHKDTINRSYQLVAQEEEVVRRHRAHCFTTRADLIFQGRCGFCL